MTLQHWLWHGQCRLVRRASPGRVYLTHFFATPLVAAVLWKVDRQRFRKFAVLVAVLSFAGLLTYALYPAAPPWMASEAHLMAQITRIIPHVWPALGLHSAGSVIEHGYRYANNVAAVPSLHAAFSLLIAITLWPRKHKWLRPLVALYPLAMAFSLDLRRRALLLGHRCSVGSTRSSRCPRPGGDALVGRPARRASPSRRRPAGAGVRQGADPLVASATERPVKSPTPCSRRS